MTAHHYISGFAAACRGDPIGHADDYAHDEVLPPPNDATPAQEMHARRTLASTAALWRLGWHSGRASGIVLVRYTA